MQCPECGQTLKKQVKDYQYKESGLNNVVLKRIPVYVCSCGNEMPEIAAIERLHQVIGGHLFQKPALLTGEEIRFLRKEMGLKAVEFARLLGASKVTISRWENSTKPVGTISDRLIRLLYLAYLKREPVSSIELIKKVVQSIKVGQKKIKIEVSPEELTEDDLVLA